MSLKYKQIHFNPEKLSIHNIDRMAVDEVPPSTFVLDVGCATGFMGAYLRRNKNCRVFGVDVRKDEINVAKKYLDKALVADIEDDSSVGIIMDNTNNRKFDVIIATSLIEHTAKPIDALMRLKRMLKKGGKIIMTTPNIVHWSIRLSMLKGNFDYEKYGILDETHLHFFTIKSFKNIFDLTNLKVIKLKVDAEGGGFPRISLFLSRFFPNLLAYQILIVAEK